jgi:hypothetical protein
MEVAFGQKDEANRSKEYSWYKQQYACKVGQG